ncbi:MULTISPECIES: WXG100 family type VII secretion target [Clostridium]|uniref:ESAT-6-like protein n=1 Tax=Clostridium cibarium TaxID=2762247 RepID=A0ABR8PQ43_9CLOT|nr:MULTISPECIES: WXG100 family type VII secretion target [Clostridium]MBD7910194.1 WXG100 family type VII secretion target [Clostridium cibarium]
MGRSITVDPSKLESAAAKMEQEAADYTRIYTQLFSEVDSMGTDWQGADNIAYTSQIKGFLDDFEKMKKLMEDYATFLRNSAMTYKNTQNEVLTQAKGLTN